MSLYWIYLSEISLLLFSKVRYLKKLAIINVIYQTIIKIVTCKDYTISMQEKYYIDVVAPCSFHENKSGNHMFSTKQSLTKYKIIDYC